MPPIIAIIPTIRPKVRMGLISPSQKIKKDGNILSVLFSMVPDFP